MTRSRHLLCLSLLLLAAMTGGAAPAATRIDPDTRIRINAPATSIDKLQLLADNVERGVNRYTGKPGDRTLPLVNIHLTPSEGDVPEGTAFTIFLTDETTRVQAAHKIAAALLLRRIPGAPAHTPETADEVSWLSAAVYHDVVELNRYLGVSRRPDYQPAFVLFEDNKYLDLKKLLANPPDPAWPYIYKLYAVHCHLLANLLITERSRTDASPAARYLALMGRGKEPYAALSTVLTELKGDETDPQEWYRGEAPQYCVQHGAVRSIASTMARLEEIMKIGTVEAADSGEKIRHEIRLSQLTETQRDRLASRGMLLRKTRELILLQQEAPLLLRPALADYTSALADLASGEKLRSFKRAIKKASERLSAAEARYAEIASYLDTVEKETGPSLPVVAPYLDIVEDRHRRDRQLMPEAERYLDEILGM